MTEQEKLERARAAARQWNAENKDRHQENTLRWRKKNKERALFARYKHDAFRKQREFDLSLEYFWWLISEPCSYCNGLGGAVDRIDSLKGYSQDNCVPCCKYCNRMKMDMDRSKFLAHVSRIYQNSCIPGS